MSRLDRIFVNPSRTGSSRQKVKALSRKSSDHLILLLFFKEVDWGLKPFKTFDYWLQNQECVNIIESTWNNLQDANISIHQKLKNLHQKLQDWNKNRNGYCGAEIKQLEEKLLKSDTKSTDQNISDIKNKLRSKYEEHDALLSQKSRNNWLQLGDSNTKFFMP